MEVRIPLVVREDDGAPVAVLAQGDEKRTQAMVELLQSRGREVRVVDPVWASNRARPEQIEQRLCHALGMGRPGALRGDREAVVAGLGRIADKAAFRESALLSVEWTRIARQSERGVAQMQRRAMEGGPDAAALARLGRAMEERWSASMRKAGTVDHEATIREAWEAVRTTSTALRWTHLVVDEYQDVNPAQAGLVTALGDAEGPTGARPRIWAVGDEWQAIFGFQGGDPGALARLGKSAGAGATYSTLAQTYRFNDACAQSARYLVSGTGAMADKAIRGNPEGWEGECAIHIIPRLMTAQGVAAFGADDGGVEATPAVRAVLGAVARQRAPEGGRSPGGDGTGETAHRRAGDRRRDREPNEGNPGTLGAQPSAGTTKSS